MNTEEMICEFLERIKNTKYYPSIEFIFFYGSRLNDYHLEESDLDICIYIKGEKDNLSRIRLDLLGQFPEKFDIQIFELLPLYVQNEVIKGKLIYVKDEDFLYEIVNETILEYEEFLPFYLDYIER